MLERIFQLSAPGTTVGGSTGLPAGFRPSGIACGFVSH